ncbi:hypothetical protein [Tetragenococcus koreensis]|nr:hypothetical protein [Tetragenococcus koreensis]
MDQVQEIYQDIFTDVQADISDSQVLVEKIMVLCQTTLVKNKVK